MPEGGCVEPFPLQPTRTQVLLQLEAADYSAYQVELVDPVACQTLWRRQISSPRVRA
jgi:hypothetical protein